MPLFVLYCSLTASLFGQKAPPMALVSIAPYVSVLDALSEKNVQVELLVPSGFSSHTYEPTPKQVIRAANASVWFIIGEIFEQKIIPALKHQNPKIEIVDLRRGLTLINENHVCSSGHSHAQDPHIWMSPKMMQEQVKTISNSLQALFPEMRELVQKNTEKVHAKLKTLDDEIRALLQDKKGATIFVSHPAYGYFCKEYGLTQVSIEFEGKDPTTKQITYIVVLAKKLGIHTIFAQAQYSTKASELIAHEVGAKIVMLDPYAENYFENMLVMAKAISQGAIAQGISLS